jgi:hypothetical protein
MMHGVCGRSAGLLILFALLCLAACAGSAPNAAEPDPGTAPAPTPTAARCGGPGPIEILAADVVIVIDRSTSTRQPTGIDIDGDGLVGEFRRSEFTDRDDSLLAAQLAAVERLVDVARLGDMRFAIVSYSGRDAFPLEDSVTQRVDREDARLEAELTGDVAELATALERVRRRGSDGASSFAPAMRLAVRSLRPGGSGDAARRRRVLFLADSPTPVRFAPASRIVRDDFLMQREARRAIEAGVSFHSFGIGSAAEGEPPHALAQIAGATGGIYRAVPDPTNLYCQMLTSLRVGEVR